MRESSGRRSAALVTAVESTIGFKTFGLQTLEYGARRTRCARALPS
jgi:hypothetical protein